MASQTLTALYNDTPAAEAAIERLRALGIPEHSLEMHPAVQGDIPPGNAPSGGLFGLGDILGTPEIRPGLGAAGTVVLAQHIPENLVAQAVGIFEDAIDVERDRE